VARAVQAVAALLGAVVLLGWTVLFLYAPGFALELALITSPVWVAAWLIVMLTARGRRPAR
jgi:hypothetical protein